MIVINVVITKVIMPYVIVVELSLLPNSCITTYPTTFVLAPPLKLVQNNMWKIEFIHLH
jgi:hypothetical protein